MLDALLIALGYLAGSIPFGVLLTRWRTGTDVREQGSGNIGATNVARVAGRKLGLLVFVLDAAKGALPVLGVRFIAPGAPVLHAAVALAAFLGHVFPVWLGFRGGKGVATAFGALCILTPAPALLGIAAYGAVYIASRVSALGSLGGGLIAVVAAFALGEPRPYAALAAVLWALMLLKHRTNLERLLRR